MFVYSAAPGVLQTTSGTPATEIDHLFIKPGTGRSVAIQALYVAGRAAAVTAISGISFRGALWTASASAGGTATTPTPRESTTQACKATAGYGTTAGVTPGTTAGGTLLAIGCGAGGPGGWVAPNPDSYIGGLESAAAKSFDVFSTSGTASMPFVASLEIVE